MSTALFPNLPGLTWDIKAVPTWSTVKQLSRRRARTALMSDPYPLWTFELTYEFLRDSLDPNAVAILSSIVLQDTVTSAYYALQFVAGAFEITRLGSAATLTAVPTLQDTVTGSKYTLTMVSGALEPVLVSSGTPSVAEFLLADVVTSVVYPLVIASGTLTPLSATTLTGYTELQQIVGFFNSMGGDFQSFLLDPGMLTGRSSDSIVSGAPLGIGDGSTTVFYTQRNAGGFIDEVQAPTAPIAVYANGVLQSSGWTLGALGAVTFATPPAIGVVLTWSGSWCWPVCFSEPSLGLDQFMFQLYELGSLKLEQVKQ